MAVLARVVVGISLLAGCYQPELRDCTVSCESSADCAGAQVCSASHLCAGKDVSCSGMTTATQDASADSAAAVIDAPKSPIDAPRAVDAAHPPIDAPAPVSLHLHVDGGGGTLTAGTHSCSDDCTYQVAYGVPIAIQAQANGNHAFAGWTQGPCMGTFVPTCTVVPTTPTNVTGRFVHGGHGGGGGD
ncbi:MAG: hypothetical protein JO257_18680 [Deltaproteobacteria bacterium]|nr:hypothetical protein [Deltaproteobacteria bacterium]